MRIRQRLAYRTWQSLVMSAAKGCVCCSRHWSVCCASPIFHRRLAHSLTSVLFLLSIIAQVALSRSHKREKRYGPSPANNYTSGSGPAKRKPWQRKKKKTTHDAELGAVGAGALANGDHDKRASNLTGTTAPVTDNGYGGPNTKYATPEPTLPAQHAGYTPHTTGVIDSGHAPHHSSGLIGGGRTSGVPEMESGVHGGPQYVEHDPNPYTEVHHGGYVHSHPESEKYTR